MVEELGSLSEPTPTQIIKEVRGSLQLEGSELAIVLVEIDDEVGASAMWSRESRGAEGSRLRIPSGLGVKWGQGGALSDKWRTEVHKSLSHLEVSQRTSGG